MKHVYLICNMKKDKCHASFVNAAGLAWVARPEGITETGDPGILHRWLDWCFLIQLSEDIKHKFNKFNIKNIFQIALK